MLRLVPDAFDSDFSTLWHSAGKILTQKQELIVFSVEGGIFKVVFDQPQSISAIRLYRRLNDEGCIAACVDCCSKRYNKLSITVRVSYELRLTRGNRSYSKTFIFLKIIH